MKTRLTTLIALTALAILAGSIEQVRATVPNNWTLVGPSAGGGYIILGSSALDLGPLGPSTSLVHLSVGGSDVITLDAGSTATSGLTQTIDLEAPNNTFFNYGSVVNTNTYGIYVGSTGNTIINRGSVTSPIIGVYLTSDHNTLNNWGKITSVGTGIDNSANYNTINNWGTVMGQNNYGLYLGDDYNTLNNWGTITSPASEGIFLNEPFNVINNWGMISGASYALYINDSHNVINNWGTFSTPAGGTSTVYFSPSYTADTFNNYGKVTANGGPLAINIAGTNNTLNLLGHSSVIGKIKVTNTGNVVNLKFSGLSPVTISSLNGLLKVQGVNTGVVTPSVTFTLRGVTYNIDPAIVNFAPSSYQLQGVTPNQQAIGASLDSALVNPDPGSPLFSLYSAIDNSGNVPAALDALSPQVFSIYGDLAIENSAGIVQEVDERMNNLRDGSESIDTSGMGGTTVAGLTKDDAKTSKEIQPAAPTPNRWGFFATGNGLFFRGSNHDATLQSGKADTAGTVAGVDGKIGDNAVIGALFAYDNAAVTMGGNGSHATIESYSGGLYGAYHNDGFYANALGAYTRNDYKSERNILFPGVATTANGSTNGNQATANLDGGYDWNLTSRLTLGPDLGLQYVHLDVDSFTESGAGPANLAVNSQSLDSLQSRVGARADYHLLTLATSSFSAEVHAAWQHEYLNDSRGIGAGFAGSGLAPFSVQTAAPLRDAAVVGAGLNFTFHNRLTLFTDYELQFWRASYFEQSINGGARISF